MKKRTPYYDLGAWEMPRRRRRWPWMLAVVALLGLAAWMWSGALRAQWRADAPKHFAVVAKAAQNRPLFAGANRYGSFP